jgi:hypothetical protein
LVAAVIGLCTGDRGLARQLGLVGLGGLGQGVHQILRGLQGLQRVAGLQLLAAAGAGGFRKGGEQQAAATAQGAMALGEQVQPVAARGQALVVLLLQQGPQLQLAHQGGAAQLDARRLRAVVEHQLAEAPWPLLELASSWLL